MINPFHYEPCADYACFLTQPQRLILNGYVFVKRSWIPDRQQTEYIWFEILDK